MSLLRTSTVWKATMVDPVRALKCCERLSGDREMQPDPTGELTALPGPCEEVTVTVGFDLFRLKKLNKRNFNNIVLNMILKQ